MSFLFSLSRSVLITGPNQKFQMGSMKLLITQLSLSFSKSFEAQLALENSIVTYRLFLRICIIDLIFEFFLQFSIQIQTANFIFQQANTKIKRIKLAQQTSRRQIQAMQRKRSQQKKDKVVQAFMNHCAIIIQSHFRGYQQKKYYRKFLPLYKRFKQLLYTGFTGWKTRKTLKLAIVKNKINEIKCLKTEQKNLQLRIAKRDLNDEISRLLKNGQWLYYYLKQKKVPLGQKTIMNKNQFVVMKKIDLKQAFNMIPKGNTRKVIQKNQNTKMPVKNVKEEQRQDFYTTKRIESNKSFEKQKKNKRFEDPPKTNIVKSQKSKQVSLKIETQIEPQLFNQSLNCVTPNQSTDPSNVFIFHTRPRDQLAANKKQPQVQKADIQEPFKQIHVNTHPHKKGLNMTLSKRPLQQKLPESTPINLQVLQDFTKKRILPQNYSKSKKSSIDPKEVSIFTTKEELNNIKQPESQKIDPVKNEKVDPVKNEKVDPVKNEKVDPVKNEKIDPVKNGRSLALQMKKEAFQKRKVQFEKKSKQFKTQALIK